MKILFSLFTLIILAESCSSTKESVTSENDQQNDTMIQNILSGTYSIQEINGHSDFEEALIISFDEASGKVSGFSGCNNFFGTYAVKGNTIEFGPFGSTKKNCQEYNNNLERQFLDALSKINNFRSKEDSVSFLNDKTIVLKVNKKAEVASKPSREVVNSNRGVVGATHNEILITYQALSRNTFEYIKISESEVVLSSDRNLKNMDSYACKSEDWESLKRMLKSIDVDNLDNLKAPTDKRLFDGAPHATFTVIKGDVAMVTPTFDHGSPPEEIKVLVNKLLSIKENASKQ